MIYQVICQYCDHKENVVFYSKVSIKNSRCSKCEDKNLTIREESSCKIDTYVGCPDFPTKEKEKEPNDDYGGYL